MLVRQHAEERFVGLGVVGQADVVVDDLLGQAGAPPPLRAPVPLVTSRSHDAPDAAARHAGAPPVCGGEQ